MSASEIRSYVVAAAIHYEAVGETWRARALFQWLVATGRQELGL